MPTNLTDRLGELVKYAQHDELCAKIAGYGYCTCCLDEALTHKDEILSALRKAEQPVSEEGPQHNAGRWLADAVELIRECRLADAYALRTGDELRWDQAFHALCRFEQQVKPILADIARLSLGDEK